MGGGQCERYIPVCSRLETRHRGKTWPEDCSASYSRIPTAVTADPAQSHGEQIESRWREFLVVYSVDIDLRVTSVSHGGGHGESRVRMDSN